MQAAVVETWARWSGIGLQSFKSIFRRAGAAGVSKNDARPV